MKYELDPLYTPIQDKPYFCVPACIQMVLDRRGLPTYTQVEIGEALGLVLPPHIASTYAPHLAGEMPTSGWGTRINEEEFSLNTFFQKKNLPLKSLSYVTHQLGNVQEFIELILQNNQDLLVCYDQGILEGKELESAGHGSLIEAIDNKMVTLADSYREQVELSDLVAAMKQFRKGSIQLGGLWTIEEYK